jgi:hypothetical protein
MKTGLLHMLFKASMVYFLALMAAFLPAASFAESSQNLTLMKVVELRPGDVINFLGGPAAHAVSGDTYGHTAMYLGIVDGEKKFLDFTTTKTNLGKGLYKGRILNAEEFLSANSTGVLRHTEFDVFRLDPANPSYKVNQPILVKQAQDIAQKGVWGVTTECASAVAKALSVATGTKVNVLRPDGYAESNQFVSASPVRVKIETALSELKGVPDSGKINGIWSGEAVSSESFKFDVTLKLQNVTGGTGDFGGECGGDLSGGYQGNGTYVYRLVITYGRRTRVEEDGCVDGTIKLVLGSENIVDYSWHGTDVDGTALSSHGTLFKRGQ